MGKMLARKLLKWLLAHGQDELHKEIDRRLDRQKGQGVGQKTMPPTQPYPPPPSF